MVRPAAAAAVTAVTPAGASAVASDPVEAAPVVTWSWAAGVTACADVMLMGAGPAVLGRAAAAAHQPSTATLDRAGSLDGLGASAFAVQVGQVLPPQPAARHLLCVRRT